MSEKYVVPNIEETFGDLEFMGMEDIKLCCDNGKTESMLHIYSLSSSIQRGEVIEVNIPASAEKKCFVYEQGVRLINPRISIGGDSFGSTEYKMFADDIVAG